MNSKFKKLYNQVKENLNLIILLPTVTGGLWQLIELSTISLSFIRFFSLSQLIPDGLLILFILTIFYISYQIGNSFYKKNLKLDVNSKPLIFPHIFLILISIFSFFFIVEPSLKNIVIEKKITISELAIMIPFLMILLGIILHSLTNISLYFLLTHKDKILSWYAGFNRKKSFKETAISIAANIMIFVFFYLIKFILIDLHPYMVNMRNDILFPSNLVNKSILDKKLITDYKLRYKPRLIYFNDKYLFYNIKIGENRQIIIVDFSALMKQDNRVEIIDKSKH